MNSDETPATKGDLKVLALEVVKMGARTDRLIDELRGELNAKFSEVIRRMDGFMANVGKVDRAQIIADWRVTELEKRVGALESKPS